MPGPDSFVAGCLGRSKVRSGHRKKPCQLVRTSAAGGRASYCCPPRPGLWPVLRFLPGPRAVPGHHPTGPSRPPFPASPQAWTPLPPPRSGVTILPSCPGLGLRPCPLPSPPPPCRHAPSLGPDLQPAALEKLLFHSFPTLSRLSHPAFSVVTTLFLCLVWTSDPRWTRFPLFIQSIFAPIPWVLARWDVGGRLCREHSIT